MHILSVVLSVTLHILPLLAASPEEWERRAKQELDAALANQPNVKKAKNVIVFIGDGMGITTITASRVYKGQQINTAGEDGYLAFEKFPSVGLIKTYDDTYQVSDSAATATAILCGQKTGDGILGLNSRTQFGNCSTAAGNELKSVLHRAQEVGKATGIVTTARITHATPAAAYSHSADRDWENDDEVPLPDRDQCKDIARQLIEDKPGKELKVIFGGGRDQFVPVGSTPYGGLRKDNRSLIDEWKKLHSNNSHLVFDRAQLLSLDISKTDKVFGLFNKDHMEYEIERNKTDNHHEPSLTEMTEAAIKLLQKHSEGFFLLVEAGRIDHGHHAGTARRALHDAFEFDRAIERATKLVNISETLMLVTADHSHVLTMAGYPKKGHSILGSPGKGQDNLPYTTLGYANGPGAESNGPRRNVTDEDTASPTFRQPALVPLGSETHGGEDVAIYAQGPFAHLFHSVHEQNYIAHVIDYAACYTDKKPAHCKNNSWTIRSNGLYVIFPILWSLITRMM